MSYGHTTEEWGSEFWNWVQNLKEYGQPLQRGFDVTNSVSVLFTYKTNENELVASLDIGKRRDLAEPKLEQAKSLIESEVAGNWEWDTISETNWGCAVTGRIEKDWPRV